MGMLAYFVHGYVDANMLTPNSILVLFIVSVLALAWALFTLFAYHRSSANARFVGLIDLGFVGAFIAGVYYLRSIKDVDCVGVATDAPNAVNLGVFGTASLTTLDVTFNKTCGMLKACFAFGIMNCIFFFFTAVLAMIHGNDHSKVQETHYRETRRSHHGGSHRRSHSGSHRSRSSHSHSRPYV